MSKFSVKKPFTVLVAVVMLLVLGIVSFTKMTTDLLPSISLPYILVITTYPGASPEKVENDVTQVLESALGTVNGVENVTSVSNENYSMITLEFAEETKYGQCHGKAFESDRPDRAPGYGRHTVPSGNLAGYDGDHVCSGRLQRNGYL